MNKPVQTGSNDRRVIDIQTGEVLDRLSALKCAVKNHTFKFKRNKNDFIKQFDDLSYEEFKIIYDDKQYKKQLGRKIRGGNKAHEWLKVSQIDKFKQWGISMKTILECVTPTKGVDFINPNGHHPSKGIPNNYASQQNHKDLDKLIEESNSCEDYLQKLNIWAKDHLKNGILDLPKILRR